MDTFTACISAIAGLAGFTGLAGLAKPMNFPPPITRLTQHFRGLPGVGPRTAARFVFALLNKPDDELRAFGHALIDLKDSIRTCTRCFNISLQNPCAICADPKREASTLCIVARPQDIQAIKEIILALNPDLEGEATSLYLAKLLKARVPRITRLGRGLQQGADLEYADEVTLINALKGRREI